MISIIVPVYNCVKYLDKCLESIHRQRYQDWECILIDDGSTDGSSTICDNWCIVDSRIRVFHQLNAGVSAARNSGIKHASGEYITFIDSDDWIEEDYLSAFVSKGVGCDLTVSGIIDQYEDGRIIVSKPCKSDVIHIEKQYTGTIIDLLKKNLLYGPTNKLYKSEIIHKNHIKFPENCSLGEDLVFNFNYLEHVFSVKTVSEAHYNYRKLQSGTLFTKIRYDQFQTDYQHWTLRYEFFKKKNLLTDEAIDLLMRLLWGVIYDGIFRYEALGYPSIKYLKQLNNMQEIDLLRDYTGSFSCAPWIKQAILKRRYVLLYLFFKLKRYSKRFTSTK